MSDDSGPLGSIKRKLVETKERWAREARRPAAMGGGHRLPPGQHGVTSWPVLDLGVQPDVPLEKWRLGVVGEVENPVVWTWEDFLAQPQTRDVSDMHCVTAWSRFDNHWEGVAARHLLSVVRPKPTARYVIFHSFDGYTTNVPLRDFDDDDVLLAHSWEGRSLPREHGGPVRVLIPKLYLWKSAKWVSRIEFTDEDRPGFWEVRGYHNHGDPWTEERYG
jgi:DMSO/TMAO reductase YedYZ molybdopterin-dependent catalytic subunit